MSGPHATYPPAVNANIIGYVVDKNCKGYSRDIGRSFELAGKHYYLFGDTFCKNSAGDYVGLRDNTAAMVLDSKKPLETAYQSIAEDGMVDGLVPLNAEELALQKKHEGLRVTLWGFGGVVEVWKGTGLHWYQKGIIYGNDQHQYCGVGLAIINVDTKTGKLTAYRAKDILFGPDEPKIGSFSALLENDWLYLWGESGDSIILARVYKYYSEHRDQYNFWNGKTWVERWQEAIPVLCEVPQGAIFRSELFGKERPWVFVGVNKWADSKVQVAASKKLEGPWELTAVTTAKGIDVDDGYKYCIYPHGWAFDAKNAELMVTWSEHWPGGVIAAKLKFETAKPDTDETAELATDENTKPAIDKTAKPIIDEHSEKEGEMGARETGQEVKEHAAL